MSKDRDEGVLEIERSIKDQAKKHKTAPINTEIKNSLVSTQTKANSILEIHPGRCKPWQYHDRDEAWLNSAHSKQLIDSIRMNGQLEPGLVRRIKEDPNFDYEIIYGLRRWYACSQLEDFYFKAQLTEADDKTCMIMMHAENAHSKDITEFERAFSFARQMQSGVFSNQTEMAHAMNLTQGYISKLIRAAEVFEYGFIKSLFSNKLDISVKDAYRLSILLKDPSKMEQIECIAKNMQASIEKTNTFPPAKMVLKKLIAIDRKSENDYRYSFLDDEQKPVLTYSYKKGNFSMSFSKGAKNISKDKLREACLKALDEYLSKYSLGNNEF